MPRVLKRISKGSNIYSANVICTLYQENGGEGRVAIWYI